MNLSELSLVQLRELNEQLPKEIARREADERKLARQELEKLAAEKGFRLEDLISNATPPKTPVAVKYRHPENSALTWTGRGRKPGWVEEYLGKGGSLEELLVSKAA